MGNDTVILASEFNKQLFVIEMQIIISDSH